MESGDSTDVQWAQTNFPSHVDPPAPVQAPTEEPQQLFLSMEQLEQLTQRLVAEKLAAIEAQYKQQIHALEAQTQELKARVQAPVVQIAVPSSYAQPQAVQPAYPFGVLGQSASLAQPPQSAPTPAAHQYVGGMPLPSRPSSLSKGVPAAVPAVSSAPDTPKNKFYLQDRRKVSANFDATDHRGVTLGSLNAGTVTNIAVGLQTRELFLNPSLRPPGIGGLI